MWLWQPNVLSSAGPDLTLAISDSLVLSDSFTGQLAHFLALSDSFTLADNFQGSLFTSLILEDSIILSDALLMQLDHFLSLEDGSNLLNDSIDLNLTTPGGVGSRGYRRLWIGLKIG